MSGKLIIITPDDEIKSADYNGYESLSEAVNGMIDYFATDIEIPYLDARVDFVCNDNFLIDNSEEFDKINAVASLLFEQEDGDFPEIRGNVAVLVSSGGGENRGFEFKEEDICEHWVAEDFLEKFINNSKDEIAKCHQSYDNNKAEPKMDFVELD